MSEIKVCGTCARKYENEKDYFDGTSRWRICSRENLWFNCSCGSTLMLKKGKYDWYDATAGMSSQHKSIFNEMSEKKNLPYIQSFVFELQELLAKSEVDWEKVTTILRREPIFTAEIISDVVKYKQAKEDYSPVNDIKHAAVFTGAKRLSDLVMVASMKTVKLDTKVFSLQKFWDHAQNAAIICEYLSKKYTPHHNSDEMYLGGFLMNIGKVISAYYYPQEVDDLAATWSNPKNSYNWSQLEKIHNLKSHVVLGEIAGSIWGFPVSVSECIAGHHKATKTKQSRVSKGDMAAFANQMTHWAMYNLVDLDQNILKTVADQFKLSDQDIENLARDLTQLVSRTQKQKAS